MYTPVAHTHYVLSRVMCTFSREVRGERPPFPGEGERDINEVY